MFYYDLEEANKRIRDLDEALGSFNERHKQLIERNEQLELDKWRVPGQSRESTQAQAKQEGLYLGWCVSCKIRPVGAAFLQKLCDVCVATKGKYDVQAAAVGKSLRTETDTFYEFSSGAKRSEKKPPYYLIPLEGLKRLAQRFGFGAEHYGENNYQKAINDEAFWKENLAHIQEHLSLYASGDRSDDHLAAISADCFMAMWCEEQLKKDATNPSANSRD